MNRNNDSSIGFAELHIQMRITNRLIAAQLKGKMQQNELVGLLVGTGATLKEIADVLGTTPATVSVTLNRQKRKTGRS